MFDSRQCTTATFSYVGDTLLRLVAAGECVKAQVERRKLGCRDEDERAEVRMQLERQRTVAAELAASGSSMRLR